MMALWIATLRMTGLGLLVLTTAGAFVLALFFTNLRTTEVFSYALIVAGTFALALISLAVAAGLHTLRDIDQRTRRQNGALRLLLPRQYQSRDLAPHAPNNWQEFKPRPAEPVREKDSGIQQRVAQRRRYSNANLGDESQEFTRPITIRRDRK